MTEKKALVFLGVKGCVLQECVGARGLGALGFWVFDGWFLRFSRVWLEGVWGRVLVVLGVAGVPAGSLVGTVQSLFRWVFYSSSSPSASVGVMVSCICLSSRSIVSVVFLLMTSSVRSLGRS
jgi:hypothetical protein